MASGDEAVARWIAALLVAEREGGSFRGSDGGAVARAIELLRRAGGDAEPLGAETVVAGFDDACAAVGAATELHKDARSGAWRIGVHVVDGVIRVEDAAMRTAIEHATALAQLARPGTTALAASALPAIGAVRDAVLEAVVVPDATAGAVYLAVPLTAPRSPRRRRLVLALAGGTVFGGAAAGAWIAAHRPWTDPRARRVTVGVGPFRLFRTDEQHTRIGIALRDGLNTELSQLATVKVYSREFVDFLMGREGLGEMEVATRLRIEKMLSGAVMVVGGSVRLEAQIVDVASGVLEDSYTAAGREENFLALETDVILGVIARLRVPLSPEDERRLGARRATDQDALRRLRESEGAGESGPLPAEPEGREGLPIYARLGPRAAQADDASAEIMALLETYRRATEARDVSALEALYVSFPAAQHAGLERYFAGVRDLRVRLVEIDVAVVGEEAIVSYTRIDDFTDAATGRPQHLALRLTRTVRRVEGRWRLSEVR